jgi:transcriptional regulator NrdR family protein
MKCQTCHQPMRTKDTRQWRDTTLSYNWTERRVHCAECGVTSYTVEIPKDIWAKFQYVQINEVEQ